MEVLRPHDCGGGIGDGVSAWARAGGMCGYTDLETARACMEREESTRVSMRHRQERRVSRDGGARKQNDRTEAQLRACT